MLNPNVINAITTARNEYKSALVSRVGREAKKTALANVLINSVDEIMNTCLMAEDLFNSLNAERARVAELEKQLAEVAPKAKKNG